MSETTLEIVLNELVIANRVLANEGVADAYGHVSVRHPTKPERFFMARMVPVDRAGRKFDIAYWQREPLTFQRSVGGFRQLQG